MAMTLMMMTVTVTFDAPRLWTAAPHDYLQLSMMPMIFASVSYAVASASVAVAAVAVAAYCHRRRRRRGGISSW